MKDEDLVAILRSTWRRRIVAWIVLAAVAAVVWVLIEISSHFESSVVAGLFFGVFAIPYTISYAGAGARRWLGFTDARQTLLDRAGWREFEDIVNHQRMRLDDAAPGTWELAVELRTLPHGGRHHATVTLPPQGRAKHRVVSRSFDESNPDPRTWITAHDAELDLAASDRLRALLASAQERPFELELATVTDGSPFRLVAATQEALDAYDLGGNLAAQHEDPRVVELASLVVGPLPD